MSSNSETSKSEQNSTSSSEESNGFQARRISKRVRRTSQRLLDKESRCASAPASSGQAVKKEETTHKQARRNAKSTIANNSKGEAAPVSNAGKQKKSTIVSKSAQTSKEAAKPPLRRSTRCLKPVKRYPKTEAEDSDSSPDVPIVERTSRSLQGVNLQPVLRLPRIDANPNPLNPEVQQNEIAPPQEQGQEQDQDQAVAVPLNFRNLQIPEMEATLRDFTFMEMIELITVIDRHHGQRQRNGMNEVININLNNLEPACLREVSQRIDAILEARRRIPLVPPPSPVNGADRDAENVQLALMWEAQGPLGEDVE